MAIRKTKRLKKTKKVRKGGNAATQFARKHGMWSFASTKAAALEIANLYNSSTFDENGNVSKEEVKGDFKKKIIEILDKDYGPLGNSRANIVAELEKLRPTNPDNNIKAGTKNITVAIQDIKANRV